MPPLYTVTIPDDSVDVLGEEAPYSGQIDMTGNLRVKMVEGPVETISATYHYISYEDTTAVAHAAWKALFEPYLAAWIASAPPPTYEGFGVIHDDITETSKQYAAAKTAESGISWECSLYDSQWEEPWWGWQPMAPFWGWWSNRYDVWWPAWAKLIETITLTGDISHEFGVLCYCGSENAPPWNILHLYSHGTGATPGAPTYSRGHQCYYYYNAGRQQVLTPVSLSMMHSGTYRDLQHRRDGDHYSGPHLKSSENTYWMPERFVNDPYKCQMHATRDDATLITFTGAGTWGNLNAALKLSVSVAKRNGALGVCMDRRPTTARVLAEVSGAAGALQVLQLTDADELEGAVGIKTGGVSSASLSIRPDGTVDLLYAFWEQIRHCTSDDGGRTFSVASTIASGYDIVDHFFDPTFGIVALLYKRTASKWYVSVGILNAAGTVWDFSTPREVAAGKEGAGRLLKREDGPFEFAFVNAAGVAQILRCNALANDGTGEWV